MPRTSVRGTLRSPVGIVATSAVLSLDELPATGHRGDHSPPLDVVVVEDQVDVHHREDDEEPHRHVMPLADGEVAPHQGHDPGEACGQPGGAHRRVHPETGDRLEEKSGEGQEVGETGESVVADRLNRLVLGEQDVDPKDLPDFPDLAAEATLAEGQELVPAGVLVADETPVDAAEEVEEEEKETA